MELAYYANQLKTELGLPVEVAVVERGTHLHAMNAGQVEWMGPANGVRDVLEARS